MKKLYSKAKHMMLLFLWLAGSYVVQAQDRTVSGTVTDETGSTMPGVNVIVSGTSTGTVTDTSGKYSVSVGSATKLLFSFIGYTSQEVEIGSNSVINVSMKVDITELSEIVVTGYASQEKKDLTGAVGTVKMKDLVQIPSSNVTNQLQGRVAGVTVSGDGRPGQPAKVRIRGFSSFNNNDPLYVVDGVPTFDVSTINPNDVESMSVLKDAGAASIYGSRAANGVIVVTTKKGTKGGTKVTYDMYYGTQDPGKKPDFLLNTQEMANLQWLVYKNDGTNETHPFYGPSTNATPTLPSWAADTDWFDLLTRKALIMNHDISMSGGNENSKFYAGVNYFNQQGIVITNFAKRFSARINSEFKIKDRVTIGENLTVTGRTGLGLAGNRSEGSPFAGIYNTQPIIPARITQTTPGISRTFQPGDYGGNGIAPRLGNTRNRLAELERNADNRDQDVRILGSMFMDVKILESLSFKTSFGGTFQNGYNTIWTGVTYENAENIATATYNENAYFNSDWVWTNTLTFNKSFGNHKVLAVAGYEAVKYQIGRGLSATRAGYFSEAFAFRTLNNGATIQSASSGFNTPSTLVSQFVRADYSFSDKYLLSATVRRDGSSRFGENNRYGVFPSVSAGWRISEESFMSGVDFISDLKIRGGYGTQGNQIAILPSNNFFLFGGSVSDSNYDLNGTGSSSLQGFRPTQKGNVDGKWETSITTNIGFDAGLFDNKLQLTVDWYSKQSKDLLFQRPLAGTEGGLVAPFVNIAEMKNTGIDIQLGYKKVITSDLTIDGTLTFTTYKNQIVDLAPNVKFFDDGGSRIGSFNRNQIGQSVSAFYGYKVLGLFQTSAEVTGAPTQDGAEPGFFRYANIDASDNVINANDRTFIGDPNPDFTYGLNLAVTYKNFDVSGFFYGSQGNDIFNYNKWWIDFWPSFQNQKSPDLLYRSWTTTNTGATTPKASNKSNFSTNTQSSSYYVEDGSFLRLKNLQVGYNIPSSIIGKIGMTRARIYLQGVNLFTMTKYSGLDPDLNSNGDTIFGVDEGNYPLVKQYIVGVNIGF
ncbi:MAG: TonB-dependent receptor [Cyclobacteriaceae bacterium]|nr:TonB-dependent receptor [Cyclobacteriaceae bacterium]